MSEKLPSGGKSASGFNYQMCLLSVIGISFVVFGHINFGSSNYDVRPLGSLYAWFPYYSFHLPIFLFVTGYFFKDFSQEAAFLKSFGRFILKKAKSMLLPFYVISGAFLLADNLFLSLGFTYLTPFSFTEWLLRPWTRCYSITWSLPIWYLVALFVTEIYYVLLRKLCTTLIRNTFARELALLLVTLAIGVISIYLKNTVHPSETVTVYLRSAVMLFFIQVGCFYRRILEPMDRLSSGWYFLVLFCLQFLLILLSGNNDLSPGLYALVNFDLFGCNYFLAGLTGLAFWLRITRLIASLPHRSRLLIFVGNNTKYIMSFHVFGFFLVNALFSALYKASWAKPLLSGFSMRTWKGYLYYALADHPRLILLYFLGAMTFSLLMAKAITLIQKAIRK